MDFGLFDKLLLESIFQSKQESQNKKNIKEYILRCTAKSLQEKQQILEIQKDISSCDETILDLQKYDTENSDCITRFASFCTVLNKEEAFLQSQLESVKNESENDKKKYQDSVCKYKEVFKQYQEQYMESALAKNYHLIKQDLDSIQNVILKLSEQWKTKEENVMKALEPIPFDSYINWGLQLAKLKKSTNETLEHISEISQATLKLTDEVNELEQKIEYVHKHIENVVRQENVTKTEVQDQFRSDQAAEVQHRIFTEGKTSQTLEQSREKHSQTLHLPDFLKKRFQPQRDIKLALQSNETARGEKESDSQRCSSKVIFQEHAMEESNQEPLINDETENSAFPATRLHHQVQLRLVPPKKHILQRKGIKDTAEIRKEHTASMPDTSKDSGYCSQVEHGSVNEAQDQSNVKVSEHEVFILPKIPTFAVPGIPSPATTTFVKKVHFSNEKKGRNFMESSDKSYSSPIEQTEKSPYFNVFKTSTPKTPNFGTFESPLTSIKFPDQGGSYSSVDITTSPPVKDFESIFGGMEGDDNFAFSFTSKSSQNSDDDKDNFGFRLPFGQDMRSTKDSEQSKSTSKFTFF